MTFFKSSTFFSEFQALHIILLYTLHLFHFIYTLYPSYTHLHPIFPFLHLTFYSRNNKYHIHLLFFHHLSSLHIFVHHCTFCVSLHVKTSPEYPSPTSNVGP